LLVASLEKRVQSQREPSAESLLYAEVKPDFAGGFFKNRLQRYYK
jgi:hypothetical protein